MPNIISVKNFLSDSSNKVLIDVKYVDFFDNETHYWANKLLKIELVKNHNNYFISKATLTSDY